jgi:hypothetical protein
MIQLVTPRAYSLPGGLRAFDRKAYDRAERVRRCAAGVFAGGATAVIGRKKNAGGGGGPTNDPTFVSVGTGFELAVMNTTGPFDVPYPGSLAAGDIIFLHIFARTPAAIPATIAGWTTAYHDDVAANSRESAVFYKTATGSESGTQSVTFLVNTNSASGIMCAFRNVNIAAGFEDAALGQASAGSFTGPTIATNGDHRMCFAFMGQDNNNPITPFGAVTGGTWVERYDFGSGVGSNCGIHLQTAIMTSAGTISGGTMSIGSDDGCMRSFAMVGT